MVAFLEWVGCMQCVWCMVAIKQAKWEMSLGGLVWVWVEVCVFLSHLPTDSYRTMILPTVYGQLLFFPRLWNNNSHCCNYYPMSICLCSLSVCFWDWLAQQGVTLGSSVIISFSENSSVVWRVNWPLVQVHSAGIWMLAHCRNSVYRKQTRGWKGSA